MRNNSTKTNNAEETDSWVYTYSTERAVDSTEGNASRLVSTTPVNKYISSFPPETPNNTNLDRYLLVMQKNTIEITPQNHAISFKVFQKGEKVPEMELIISMRDTCALLGLLAQAIGEGGPTKLKQESY